MVVFIVLQLIYADFSLILGWNMTFLYVVQSQEKGIILSKYSKCTICSSVLFCAVLLLHWNIPYWKLHHYTVTD